MLCKKPRARNPLQVASNLILAKAGMSIEGEYSELKARAEAMWQNTLDSLLWKGGIPDARKDQDAVKDWARAFALASVAFPEISERERDQLVRLHYARRSC